MSLIINMELSDQDLAHFTAVRERALNASSHLSLDEITRSASELLLKAQQSDPPQFVKDRLLLLDSFIAMARDEGWALPEDDITHVRTALSYFAVAADAIPDHVPVLGYLDDAIMIELCARDLCHEVDAYNDFCDFRDREARRHGQAPENVGRADWLAGRREELQERMRRRRSRLGSGGLGVGYGSSSGYGGVKSYADGGWRPGVFTTR